MARRYDWEERLFETARAAEEYFMERDRVHAAMRALARLLDEEGIAYAIAGAMALGAHATAA